MPVLTSEAAVRLRFQFLDPALVPSELIADSIEAAHMEILRFIEPDVDLDTPDGALVMGETLLAGVYVFRALASRHAVEQRTLSIGGGRIGPGDRFAVLSALAEVVETQAWYLLEPYVISPPSHAVAQSTGSIPVLGEE